MHQSDLLMDSSILYRSTQKYYDKMLKKMNLTYGQLPILIRIYEEEGITSQKIAKEGAYDKGTITKNVQKLESLGYVYVQTSQTDRRVKKLYTSDLAKTKMSEIYQIRRDWWKHLIQGMDPSQIQFFSDLYQNMAFAARDFAQESQRTISFFHLQKLNVHVYPGKLSAVLRTGGCNFHCPNCSCSKFVYLREDMEEVPQEEILGFLKDSKQRLDAICIQGGEPLMHEGLDPFLSKIRKLGYLIQIHTNGSFPEHLKKLIHSGLIDRVVLSIKQDPNHYGTAIGLQNVDWTAIETSKQILMRSKIDFCFETRFDPVLHHEENILAMAKWLQGDVVWYWKIPDSYSFSSIETFRNSALKFVSKIIVEEIL